MQTQYEELNAVISLGYDFLKGKRCAQVIAKDGVAERYLQLNGADQLADEIGLFDMIDGHAYKRSKYKYNVYRVSATIEIIDGEFADMSQIVISEPLLAESALYV